MNNHVCDSANIVIRRPALNRVEFDELCQKYPVDNVPAKDKFYKEFQKLCHCSGTCVLKKLLAFFPIINILKTYKFKEYLPKDIFAGISTGIIHIPQGMGFALLASVSPVYGLYSSFFPVLIYLFFGSSAHVCVGTMAIISILVGSVVDREAEIFKADKLPEYNLTSTMYQSISLMNARGDNSSGTLPDDLVAELEIYKASVASAVSLVAGMIMFGMGVFRMGIITTFMPTSFLGGFTTGSAIHIATSQMTSALGIQVQKFEGIMKIPYSWIDIFSKVPTANVGAVIISITSLILLIFFKEYINERFKKNLPFPIPIEMLVLALGTLLSYFLKFNEKWSIQIVGPVPRGLPAPSMPPLHRTSHFVIDAAVTAIVSFAISISMADLFARKHKYTVDPNQELIANGLAYGLSSFFSSFIGAAAPPRCFVHDSAGVKTQVANIFTALLLLLVLLAIGPLFQSLPNSVLSSIIIVAIFPLFKQFSILPTLWRISKADFSIWTLTLLASIFLDLTFSLVIGVGWSIVTIAITAITASGYNLGVAYHQDLYAPTKMYKNVQIQTGIAIFRFESGLFFASIKSFKNQLFKATVDPRVYGKTPKSKPSKENNETVQLEKESKGVDNPALDVTELYSISGQNGSDTKPGAIAASPTSIKVLMENGHDESESERLHAIILDCSSFAHVDFMGIGVLKELYNDYKNAGITFLLAGCTSNLMEKLWADRQLGGETGDSILIYPTITDALLAISYKGTSGNEQTVTPL